MPTSTESEASSETYSSDICLQHHPALDCQEATRSTWLLDAKQVADLLNVPPTWIYAEARRERIPHVRLGRYIRFDEAEVRAWVADCARGPRGQRGSGRQRSRETP